MIEKPFRVRPARALVVTLALLAVPAALALAASSCVTTEHQAGAPREELLDRGPDPRALVEDSGERRALAPSPGMRVVSLPSASDPLINVRAMFFTGSRDDPAGKEGLTRLSATLMAEATESLSASELREALSPWAAELSVQVDKDTTVFIGRVHKDHAAAFLPIFVDVLLAPRLDPADFARKKSETLSFLKSELREADDERLQREALEVAIYDSPMAVASKTPQPGRIGGPGPGLVVRHPYRHTPAGTVRGVESVTLDDVKAHIRSVFTQDRLVFGTAGGVDEGVVQSLTGALARLPATSPKRPALPVVGAPLANRALIIDKTTPGSAISVGYAIGVKRDHPDYAALKVAEAFFGGHRDRLSWLSQVMREQRELDHGAYAYVEHFVEQPGSEDERLNIGREQQYFSIQMRPVAHAQRHFALRQAVYELERFVERGIPDDETFARLLSSLPGHWQQQEQQAMRRLGCELDRVYYGVPFDRDGLRERVAKLTRDEVNAAIKRHLRADKLHLVVVTQGGDAFAKELVAGAPSPITYAAERPAALLEEDEAIAAWDLNLDEGAVRVVRPEALFER